MKKLTVKKDHLNNEMFFSPFMSLINREKLCVNREKIGTKTPPYFFIVSFSPFTSFLAIQRAHEFYTVQLDAAVLGDRLPEGTQKASPRPRQPLFCSAGSVRALESACRVSML